VAPVAEAVEAPASPAASVLSQAASLLSQEESVPSQEEEEFCPNYDGDDDDPHNTEKASDTDDVASVHEGDESDKGGGAPDASAAPRGDEPPPPAKILLRRSGLSVTSLVDRSGDLFTKSQRVQHNNVQALILVRDAAIKKCNLAWEDILPLAEQKRCQDQLKKDWLSRPERKGQWEAAMKRHGGASSKASRDMTSNYRTFCFEQWGGEPWLKIFLALGDVSKEVVGIVNEILTEIIQQHRGALPSLTPVTGPRLAPRAAAASRGEPVPEVRGITHARCDPEMLREKAKWLDKRMAKWTEAWMAGRGHNETCSWDTLVKQREEPR